MRHRNKRRVFWACLLLALCAAPAAWGEKAREKNSSSKSR